MTKLEKLKELKKKEAHIAELRPDAPSPNLLDDEDILGEPAGEGPYPEEAEDIDDDELDAELDVLFETWVRDLQANQQI